MQLYQEAAPFEKLVILYLAGEGEDVKLCFYHPGQFQWKDPIILRSRVKGDQPLLMRVPKTPIEMPDIKRNLVDFQTFAKKHSISLVSINIEELRDEMRKRGRLLSCDGTIADEVWASLESSVMEGYRPELIALLTLSLLFFGNTELALIFIFCNSKYSAVTLRQTMRFIWENNFKS